MKNVLIVDDEKSLIESMKVGFETFKDSFSILTARNGKEAIAVLESTPIDLVVTDLRMPEIDGLELLAYLSSNFPTIPAIVMTAFGTPEIEEKLKAMGVIKFMDKPIEFDDLAQSIAEGLKHEPPGGSLSGISVGSFLQLVEMERKTCLLEVRSNDGEKGLFYFYQGSIYDAVFSNLKGEEAFYEIIRLDNVKISFKNLPNKKLRVKKRIKTPLMSLIMKGSILKDEAVVKEEVVSVVEESKAVDEGGEEEDNMEEELCQERDIEEPAEEYDAKSTGNEGRSQMAGLKDILKEMAGEMDGVIALGVIGMDGIAVATHNPTGTDMDAISAKFAMLMKLGEKSTNDIKTMGEFEENLAQAKNAWILTRFLGKEYYMALVVSREETLGNVRLVAQKYADQLYQAI